MRENEARLIAAMTPACSLLRLKRFEYTRLGEQLALLRLLTASAADLRVPADAKLVVHRELELTSHPARAYRVDRDASGLLWRVSFAVPLDVVEYPHALFEFIAPGCAALALLAPDLKRSGVPDLAELRSGLVGRGYAIRRLAAIATVLTVGAGYNPVFAVAASGGHLEAALGKTAAITTAVHSPSGHLPASRPVSNAQLPASRPVSNAQLPASIAARRRAVWVRMTADPQRLATSRATAPVDLFSVLSVHRSTQGASIPPSSTGPGSRHQAGAPGSPTTQHRVTWAKPKHADRPTKAGHNRRASGNRHRTRPHPRATGGAPIISRLSPSPEASLPSVPSRYVPASAVPPTTLGKPAPAGTNNPWTVGLGGESAQARALSRLSWIQAKGNQPPVFLIPIYKAAARRYHVPWKILAAINAIETSYGRNLRLSSAGAIGWMQFMPGTWRAYGVSADGNGLPNPYNPSDAIFSAARYLAANGATSNLRQAVFAYNHANWYVDEVLLTAKLIRGGSGLRVSAAARQKLQTMIAMADLLVGKPYVWGGGHSDWGIQRGYDCSGFVSAVLHSAGYLDSPQTTETLPSQPGIQPGPGQFVTIFDRTGAGGQSHVIIDLGGQFYESGGSAGEGGGAGVKKLTLPPPDYLASFNRTLHPAGL